MNSPDNTSLLFTLSEEDEDPQIVKKAEKLVRKRKHNCYAFHYFRQKSTT